MSASAVAPIVRRSDDFAFPMRSLLRLCFEILAVQQSDDPFSPQPKYSHHGVRDVVEDILETFISEEFMERVGVCPAYAQQFIEAEQRRGLKKDVAIRKLLAHVQEAQAEGDL